MNTATSNRMVNNYFRYMQNWDVDTEKNLIVKLTDSINSKPEEKSDFSSCFGAWADSRSADEIINELRADRVNRNEIEEF